LPVCAGVGVKLFPDHPLVLGVVLSGFGLEEIHAFPAQANRCQILDRRLVWQAGFFSGRCGL